MISIKDWLLRRKLKRLCSSGAYYHISFPSIVEGQKRAFLWKKIQAQVFIQVPFKHVHIWCDEKMKTTTNKVSIRLRDLESSVFKCRNSSTIQSKTELTYKASELENIKPSKLLNEQNNSESKKRRRKCIHAGHLPVPIHTLADLSSSILSKAKSLTSAKQGSFFHPLLYPFTH